MDGYDGEQCVPSPLLTIDAFPLHKATKTKNTDGNEIALGENGDTDQADTQHN